MTKVAYRVTAHDMDTLMALFASHRQPGCPIFSVDVVATCHCRQSRTANANSTWIDWMEMPSRDVKPMLMTNHDFRLRPRNRLEETALCIRRFSNWYRSRHYADPMKTRSLQSVHWCFYEPLPWANASLEKH